MKLLVWIVAIGALALCAWYVASRPRYRRRLRSLADFSWAVLSLALLAGAVYAAHSIGLFSIPLVALAFVPIGLAARWLLVNSRASRERQKIALDPPRGSRWEKVALPVLVLMVVATAVLAVAVGTLVGPH